MRSLSINISEEIFYLGLLRNGGEAICAFGRVRAGVDLRYLAEQVDSRVFGPYLVASKKQQFIFDNRLLNIAVTLNCENILRACPALIGHSEAIFIYFLKKYRF